MSKSVNSAVILATAVIWAGAADSSFAAGCNQTVAVEQAGSGNKADVTMSGCNAVSNPEPRPIGSTRSRPDRPSKRVALREARQIGQIGKIKSQPKLPYKGGGMRQPAADGPRLDIKVVGDANTTAVSQRRRGAVTRIQARGQYNTIVVGQH